MLEFLVLRKYKKILDFFIKCTRVSIFEKTQEVF